MPFVTSDILAAVSTNFRTLFNDAFLAATNGDKVRNRLAMEVQSNAAIEDYSWFGTVPLMREWIGERQLSQIAPVHYQIANKDWEVTLEVDRDAIEDDKLGQYTPKLAMMGAEAVRSQEQLVVDVLKAGTTGLGYDGQFFFDTDHVTPGATYQTNQSNKLTGSGVTLAAFITDLSAAIAAMRNFKDDQGRPMNLAPSTIMVPPALEFIARQAVNSAIIPGGTNVASVQNPWANNFDLLVNGYLTDANDWYLLALDYPVKPIVFQMRRAVQFNSLDNPNNNEAAFMRRRYMYGADGRWNAGYGMWQFAVLTTN